MGVLSASNQIFNSYCSVISVPGSLKWRARNVLLGSVLGAGICFPLGNINLSTPFRL